MDELQSRIAAQKSKQLSATYTRETVDAVSHFLFHESLTPEQKEFALETLLGPSPTECLNKSNAEIVDEDFLAQYAHYRYTGLSLRDTAAMLRITTARLNSILRGVKLSSKVHKELLEVELSAAAHLKYIAFTALKNHVATDWKAAVAMLEKHFPQEYGKQLNVKSESVVRMSTEECSTSALKAKEELERIRRERAENKGVPVEELYVEEGSFDT